MLEEKSKKIKDPIYGYIKMPVSYITGIIDTPPYQRLRRIIQTSYSPLYPGAVHNRFAHSLGVFHLGTIVSESIKDSFLSFGKTEDDIENLLRIFRLACLLHDVGHAPFSHTGEQYFLIGNNDYKELYSRLDELIGNKEMSKAFSESPGKKAAPHEVMSAIIGLSQFSDKIGNTDEKVFFCRCITGYGYSADSIDAQLKNCLISLLNSNVIDVDKLDYLLRDAYYTGHGTVNIDYQRLLASITIVKTPDGQLRNAFMKQAVSVIENVVYAHDTERKWIQNHPTVLYESHIVAHMMKRICQELERDGKKLFSELSLTEEGQCFNEAHISLLSDDDIIFLAKRHLSSDQLTKEYFDRRLRRHPLWKSESEYKSYITDMISAGTLLDEFVNAVNLTSTYISKNTENGVITDKTIATLKMEIESIDKSIPDEADREVQKRKKNDILRVLNALSEYAHDKGFECNYVMLTALEFISGFGKHDFANILIAFDENSIAKVGDVVSSISAKESNRHNYFYIFLHRPNNTKIDIDKRDFCRYLLGRVVFLSNV